MTRAHPLLVTRPAIAPVTPRPPLVIAGDSYYTDGFDKSREVLLEMAQRRRRLYTSMDRRPRGASDDRRTDLDRDRTGGNQPMVAATGAQLLAHANAKNKIPGMDRGLRAGDVIKIGKTVELE